MRNIWLFVSVLFGDIMVMIQDGLMRAVSPLPQFFNPVAPLRNFFLDEANLKNVSF
jgi:hypothetical protein